MPKKKSPTPNIGTCTSCSRKIRSKYVSAAEAPGTARGVLSKGLCERCIIQTRPAEPRAAPTSCKKCLRPLRSMSSRAADFPGTVPGSVRRRLCMPCQSGTRVLAPPGQVKRCQGCCKETRPWGATKAAYPNTVARGSARLCIGCHQKEQRGLPYWEIDARNLDVPELTLAERVAATRVILRSGGDMLVLEALGLADVYAQVR